MVGGPEGLDREYAEGRWDYLAGDGELPRFGVVAAYCHRFAPAQGILEIGCGEGLLAERLDPSRYSHFHGVDISRAAVLRAQARHRPRASFSTADAASYEPHGQFEVIVFNEVLEYLADPAATVRRYERWLAPGGVFIVSQFVGVDTLRTWRIWRRLERTYRRTAGARVSASRRHRWDVRILRP